MTQPWKIERREYDRAARHQHFVLRWRGMFLWLLLAVGAVGLALILANRAHAAEPESYPVRQVWAIDGDTLDLLNPREPPGLPPRRPGTAPQKERVRLITVDAPETWRPHCEAERLKGLEAKWAVINLLRNGKRVTVTRPTGRKSDPYGRTLADIAVDGQDIGRFLIARGLAVEWRPGSEAKAARIAHWCGRNGGRP